MKKNILVIAILAGTLMSCGGSKPAKVSLKSEVDSVSYAIGMARTRGFIQYLAGQMGVDTTYMKDFVKGFYEGAAMGDDAAKTAYIAGLQIGQSEIATAYTQINENMFGTSGRQSMSKENYMGGFVAGAANDFSIMTPDEADAMADRLFNYFSEKRIEDEYSENKLAGEEYLAKKAKEEGVIATGSGLLYKVIKQGNGPVAGPRDRVKAIYKGSLVDGTVFDSSTSPVELRVNGVIDGWKEILQIMPQGSKYEIYIPYNLAYGTQEQPGSEIKPYSALIFELEVAEVVPAE
ncbi:MAG: FKBP-type peptidyl-prolyl cis-trans isomerase [Bacteroidaceae bacterium]|nr:FKBP-type peptidyl-prolyl cis-trans isomerase [Bacteroidaceae bacterium]